ncbi:hypothetical protein ASPWEDRAFT_24388 [Aspergillus wentii DTO 134E9]|uniref:Myb-like domain-containing protein n=1 Tax=Aspergillus wentii DTO 134E9 TaxID=1073089 RepID=A0A1L9RUG1_ASPWE|nr:uncharacterized protein ASPWEDRAFT_24388 [Aspergillus wentii DTO 134E9]KAI9934083.1 Transcription factor TFIIIB component B [Aspergillus wentii]OJJ38457.1 hypothetical protein ASPWEDRAFT_24388 [Aspergillus wentii DTO 134E9]
MKSFSSSAINKSGKKFAPKAPIRRAPAASSSAPPRRPSFAQQQQTPSQPSQPVKETPIPEPESSTLAPAPTPVPAAEPPAFTETPVAESSAQELKAPQPVTAIPVPRPKQKAPISALSPTVTKSVSTTPQPTPPTQNAPTAEPTPIQSIENEPDNRRKEPATTNKVQVPKPRDRSRVSPVPSVSRGPAEPATEIRPSKRLKTTTETSAVAGETQPTPPQILTPPATQTSEAEGIADGPDQVESRATSQSATEQGRKTTKPRSKRSTRSGSNENARGTGRQRRPRAARKPREPTPEGAETVEIAPAMMKMSDLCKDLRTGKLSKRETELRNMEIAEQERKEKAQQEGEAGEQQTPIKQNGDAASPSAAAAEEDGSLDKKQQAGPVMRIVNGEIVLDTASLQVDRHADAARNVGELEDVVENSLTRKINQSTYGKRSKTESWDEEMTDLFYRGLRMFGTDFMVISKMFPGRSRRQIKLKFNNEERKDPQRIKETLMGPRETIDIATYSEMTNTVYDDPRAIQRELDEEKKQIEDQHAKEKEAQEELLRNPDGGKDANAAAGDKGNAAVAKGKSRSKKQTMKQMNSGTEEVLGSIDDFP